LKEFKKHKDIGNDEFTNKRYRTLIIQLSNFDDYDGGDLIIWDENEVTETICSKEIGNMILFPSKLSHQAKPVTSGTRYVMTFFLTNEHFNLKNTLI
jgi:PKHD-type hydroxylase